MPYCKYKKQRRQYSMDGVNWINEDVYQTGDLIECNLDFCVSSENGSASYERWITVEDEYECSDGNKYTKLKKQVSEDGIDWQDSVPEETMPGSLIEAGSIDCDMNYEHWEEVAGEYLCVSPYAWIYSKNKGSSKTSWQVNGSQYGIIPDSEQNDTLDSWISNDELKSMINFISASNEITQIKFLDTFVAPSLTMWNSAFSNCPVLEKVDFTNVDMSAVQNMGTMFYNSSSLKEVIFTNTNTSSLRVMEMMFRNCVGLTNLNLTELDVTNVRNFDFCFDGCTELKELNLATWCSTYPQYSMYNMFNGCSKLETLHLDTIVGPETDYLGYSGMFRGCNSLKTIYCPREFKTWVWDRRGTSANDCGMSEEKWRTINWIFTD